MMLPMEMVFVDQFNWVFPRIDVAHLIHSMVLRGVIPAGLPPTPRNNFEVEYMMRVLRPYHGVILRGEPALDMYSDKLMKDFLGAYKMERRLATGPEQGLSVLFQLRRDGADHRHASVAGDPDRQDVPDVGPRCHRAPHPRQEPLLGEDPQDHPSAAPFDANGEEVR